MKQAKLIELGQMLEAWRHQVRSHGRTLTVQELCRLAPMSAHTFQKVKKRLLTDLTFLGRILAVYHRLLAADPQKQDELLRDFFRSLTTDLERIKSTQGIQPPHTKDTER